MRATWHKQVVRIVVVSFGSRCLGRQADASETSRKALGVISFPSGVINTKISFDGSEFLKLFLSGQN